MSYKLISILEAIDFNSVETIIVPPSDCCSAIWAAKEKIIFAKKTTMRSQEDEHERITPKTMLLSQQSWPKRPTQ